jgi:hypothetical protein
MKNYYIIGIILIVLVLIIVIKDYKLHTDLFEKYESNTQSNNSNVSISTTQSNNSSKESSLSINSTTSDSSNIINNPLATVDLFKTKYYNLKKDYLLKNDDLLNYLLLNHSSSNLTKENKFIYNFSNPSILINKNNIQSSIYFTLELKDFQKINLFNFNISATSYINIELNSNIGIDNRLIITFLNNNILKTVVYNIGIINIKNLYYIAFDKDNILMYLNGDLIKPSLIDSVNLENYIPKSNIYNQIIITPPTGSNNKLDLLYFNTVLNTESIQDLNKMFSLNNYNIQINNESIGNQIIDDIQNQDKPPMNSISNYILKLINNGFNLGKPSNCIFTESKLCELKECTGVNWQNPQNIDSKCKLSINNYCRGNTKDNGCNYLRYLKNLKNAYNEQQQNKLMLHPSYDIDKIKKNNQISVNNTDESSAKCTKKTCDTKVDISKYKE